MKLEERLENLRRIKRLTKGELYQLLEVSPTLVSYMISNKRAMSVKFQRRLEDAERQAGVLLKIEGAGAVAKKRGTPEDMGLLLHEMEKPMDPSVDIRNLPGNVLEDLFKSLGNAIKQATGMEREKMVNSLDAVCRELERRKAEGELILHRKGPKPAVNSPLTSQEEGALASFAAEIEPGDAGGSGPSSGAGGPHPRKGPPSSASSPGTKPRRSGDATKEKR